MNSDDEQFVEGGDEEEEDDVDEILSSPFIRAAVIGDLATAKSLLEQGADKNEVTNWGRTAMHHAAERDYLPVVSHLVELGADIEKADTKLGDTPLARASNCGSLDVVRYLLEQGANRDKVDASDGWTPLHCAANHGHLEIAKLLMVYGADLNIRDQLTDKGQLPIDYARSEEIRQATRDEPRRRMDEAPGKRATEEDRHPNAATSAAAQQEDEEAGDEDAEPSNKRPRLYVKAEEVEVAEEDEDSEPSSDGGDA